jgi:hypothetical protein
MATVTLPSGRNIDAYRVGVCLGAREPSQGRLQGVVNTVSLSAANRTRDQFLLFSESLPVHYSPNRFSDPTLQNLVQGLARRGQYEADRVVVGELPLTDESVRALCEEKGFGVEREPGFLKKHWLASTLGALASFLVVGIIVSRSRWFKGIVRTVAPRIGE